MSATANSHAAHETASFPQLFGIETMNMTRPAVVQSIRMEAKDIISIDLRPCGDDAFPPFSAGSHIDVHLPNGIIRNYSLLNPPGETHRYVIAVLRDPASRGGSSYIHEHLHPGAQLPISLPRNNFPLHEQASHSVLVAGGIGVTPLLSMMHRLRQLGRSFEVLYFARSRESAAFIGEIEAFDVKTHWHFDDSAQGSPDLTALLAARPGGAGHHYYACGPAGMLDAFVQACRALGYPNAYIERFAAEHPVAPASDHAQGYVVELKRSGQTLFVAPGQSLADVLNEARVDIGFSCKEGICGACETEVLEGTPDHRDSVFSAEEHTRNRTMMVCVSGCKSKRLVLNL